MRLANRMASVSLGMVLASLMTITPAKADAIASYDRVVDLGWQNNLTVPSFPSIDDNGNLTTFQAQSLTKGPYTIGGVVDTLTDPGVGITLYNYLYKSGSSTNILPALLKNPTTDIQGFNSSGGLVGNTADPNRPSFYYSAQTGQMIQPKGLPGDTHVVQLYGINNLNQMIGYQNTTPLFYSSPTAEPIAFKDLLSIKTGWTFFTVSDINDRGEIVGQGMNPAGQYADYGLIPATVPEPSSLAFYCLAVTMIGAHRLKIRFISSRTDRKMFA